MSTQMLFSGVACLCSYGMVGTSQRPPIPLYPSAFVAREPTGCLHPTGKWCFQIFHQRTLPMCAHDNRGTAQLCHLPAPNGGRYVVKLGQTVTSPQRLPYTASAGYRGVLSSVLSSFGLNVKNTSFIEPRSDQCAQHLSILLAVRS